MNIEVINGTFSYPKTNKIVLDNINFKLPQGKIMTILGSNGVGKTTLIKCILGIYKWDKGHTILDEKPLNIWKNNLIWQKIGYVPQAKLSAFSFTVNEMVLLGRSSHLKMIEQPGKHDIEIANQAMEEIGIYHLRDRNCSQISGGELQMVLIARALATEPEILILDEPESNLDFKNQKIIVETIERLCKDKGISAIINTHYPEHAIKLSDYSLLLKRGGASISGEAKDILNEENFKSIFDIDVKIRSIDLDKGVSHTCVIPL